MNSTNEKEVVARIKKTYAVLNEAQARAIATYGPVETWFINDSISDARIKRYEDRVSQFLNVEKTVV